MNTLRILLVLVTLSGFAQLSKSFGENSLVINGDGFKNQKVVFQIHVNDFKTNYFARFNKNVYEEDSNHTVKCSGRSNLPNKPPIMGMEITFSEFKGVGTYDLEDIGLIIYFKNDTPEPHSQIYMNGIGQLVVTKADTIGKLVEGYFSGKFTRFNYNSKTKLYDEQPVKVDITQAKFSAVHYPDFRWNQPASTGNEPVGYDPNEEKKKKKK